MNGVVVIGVGNRYRRDDGAGPAVLDALAVQTRRLQRARLVELDGEPARIVDAWTGADLAVVVDAVRSDRRARRERPSNRGRATAPSSAARTVRAREVMRSASGVPSRSGRPSTACPTRLVVFGIEGADFGHGERGLGERSRKR